MGRAFILAMACGALTATGIVAGVNWVVDPLQIYTSPRIEGFNALKPALKARSRAFKTITVANGDWDALIVGTSRADTGLDPRHPFFAGGRCFNAGIAGEDYGESLALVEAAQGHGRLNKVVALLDFEIANAYYEGAPDFTVANYRPWRKATLAASLDILRESLRAPLRQDRDELLRNQSLWLADGRYLFPPPASGHRAIALASESEYLATAYFRGPQLQYALATGSSRPLDRVRSLVAFAHANAIDLTLVIAPSHARQWETIAAAGLWGQAEAWKRALVTIVESEARNATRPRFPVWDFSGYNEVTTEPFPALDDATPMRWYYDSSHFNPAAGDRMLDRIAGREDIAFGVLLTQSNIDEHLARTREGRARWRATFPQDAAEIEMLAREAALFRGSRQLHR
jgi:hypothetical protein